MNERNFEAEGRFYQTVAEILGIPHTYKPWIGRPPNRWNNRHPGNGRFPGYGTARMYGPNLIHIALHAPVSLNRKFASEEAAYEALRTAISTIK